MEFLNNEDAQTYRCYVVGFEFNWQRLKESRIISLKSVYSGYISRKFSTEHGFGWFYYSKPPKAISFEIILDF